MDEAMNNKDENSQLMSDKDHNNDENSDYKSSRRYFRENRRFCYCFSLKCGIIFLSIIICLDFAIEIIQVIAIFNNEHFDPIYPQIYVGILAFFFIGVAIVLTFLIGPDNPTIRSLIPWGFLIVAIANILIATWIIIYISAIYHEDQVYIGNSDKSQIEP